MENVFMGGVVPTSYRFGDAEVRSVERLLLIRGQPVAVGARAFDLLLALIQHRERLVTKNELFDLVWPGVVVEENNLPTQISTLRRLLGPKTIATIPGRGYRFAQALEADVPGAPSEHSSPAVPAISEDAGAFHWLLPASVELLGRDDDLAALRDALRLHRLVTLVGAGGIGKTALALAAAHASRSTWREGACWVDLTSITSPPLVAVTMAQALHLPIGRGKAPLRALVSALETMEVLVVMDNVEHLIEAVARLVDTVLAEAAGVHFLVTSQVPLKVDRERLFRLSALAVPGDHASAIEASTYGSVAFFVDQCQAMDRSFQLNDGNVRRIIRLCRQLDGLPLAIKLAAARLPLLGLQGLEARLEERFKLLVGNEQHVPVRQRTLVATLGWSHALLPARDQVVFRRLAAFVGGFTLESAMAVASGPPGDDWEVLDSLAALVDRSLVDVDGGDPPRYRMLESTRQYAMDQLRAASELELILHRHARAMTRLLERADEEVWWTADTPWLATYAPELGNARAAMDWCMEHDVALGITLTGAVVNLFFILGLLHELRDRSEALEPHLGSHVPRADLARYWVARCRCSWGGDHRRMIEYAVRAEQLYRLLGDERGLCVSLYCAANSGMMPADKSSSVLEELARMDGPKCPPRLQALIKDAEFQVLHAEGRYAALHSAAHALMHRQGAIVPRQLAESQYSWIANWIVLSELELGNVEQAVQLAREVVGDQRALKGRHSMLMFALGNLARGLLLQGILDEARGSLSLLFDRCRFAGWHGFTVFSDLCTLLTLCERRLQAAAMLVGYSDSAWGRMGQPRTASGARFRARTDASLKKALGASVFERLTAEGAQLDEEAVCALALSSV